MNVLPLTGFDAEFLSLPHYIRVITDRIWEGRRIDDIYRYYSDPCVVETPLGVSSDVADVVNGTRATLAMFPDRRLLAEDIIVSGDAANGFLSSHRIISPMTHLGDGSFGAATGRRVHARTVADCVCKDNRIIHEWLVRDHAAIAYAIGTTPEALAARWLNERGGWTKQPAPPPPTGYQSALSTAPLAQRYWAATAALLMGSGDAQHYDEAVAQIAPRETHRYGRSEAVSTWQRLSRSFAITSDDLALEHLAVNTSDDRGARAALRFRANALHTGGAFGEPTHRRVEIMGIVHADFVDGCVLREWVLIDEVALWMQVLAAPSRQVLNSEEAGLIPAEQHG